MRWTNYMSHKGYLIKEDWVGHLTFFHSKTEWMLWCSMFSCALGLILVWKMWFYHEGGGFKFSRGATHLHLNWFEECASTTEVLIHASGPRGRRVTIREFILLSTSEKIIYLAKDSWSLYLDQAWNWRIIKRRYYIVFCKQVYHIKNCIGIYISLQNWEFAFDVWIYENFKRTITFFKNRINCLESSTYAWGSM